MMKNKMSPQQIITADVNAIELLQLHNSERLCHLPFPYPNELLYSVIARQTIHLGSRNIPTIATDVFGRITKPHVDIPSSLEKVSKHTRLVWGMSGEEIANRLTLFPYHARYMPPEHAKRCLRMLLSDNGGGIHAALGINGSRVKTPRFLRFCDACRKSDISKYGETYWHRSHQLAGVLVCPEHGEPLIDTKVLMRPRRYSDYADATLTTCVDALADNSGLDEKGIINALKIAKRCQEMLLGLINLWPAENVHLSYRRAALERGFIEDPLSISQAKLENGFVSFYGESLLFKLGCEIRIGTGNSWINTIFQKHHSLFHPIEHALVQIFLEDVPLYPINLFGLGPWKCPNPYAQHTEEFPIKRVKIFVGTQCHHVASARCRCGFRFTFLRTSNEDPHLPIIHRKHGLGPTWAAEAKRLKNTGLGTSAIAKVMGIDRFTARRLIKRRLSDYQVSPAQIVEWRQQWLKLLGGAPIRGRSLVYRKHQNLYRRLRRHDPKWLSTQPRRQSGNPKPRGQVNWASRDEEWARLLRAAAAKIGKEVPLARVTKNAMITQAGISTSIFAYLNRLPLCRSALSECSESREASRKPTR